MLQKMLGDRMSSKRLQRQLTKFSLQTINPSPLVRTTHVELKTQQNLAKKLEKFIYSSKNPYI